ncbi:MAG: mannosyltransferase family protein [Holophagae bacterium]
MDLAKILKPPVARLACLFVASRLALLAVGVLSASLLPSGIGAQPGNLVWHQPAPLAMEIWARWDAEWYLLIAAEGYDVGDRLLGLGVAYERSAAAGFLPLYPFLIRALTPIFGAVTAGVLVSNLCLFLTLVLLDRLLRVEVAGEVGEAAGVAACAALLLHPSSLFLSAVYPESLFLMLSVGAFVAARSGRFEVAGVLAGLATLARPFGVLLMLPLAWEWWQWRSTTDESAVRRARALRGIWLLSVPIAMTGYLWFSRSVFGDPLALLHRQQRWRGGLSGPWRAFVRWWEAGPTAHGAHGSTVELIIAVVSVAMLVVMARRLRLSYTLYTAAAVALALGSTLWSFSRLSLTLFPFSMLVGVAWAEGRRCLPTLYAFVGGALGTLLMALYANWWWAG